MAEFDMEVRNSVRQLATEVGRLQTGVERTNQSLRQMASETRAVSTNVAQTSTSIDEMGRAARKTGLEGGKMVGNLMQLVAFNPVALAAGAGLGVLVSQISNLITGIAEAKKQRDELAAAPGQGAAGLDAAGKEALLKTDVAKGRALEFNATGTRADLSGLSSDDRRSVLSAARDAELTGLVTQDEAIKNILKSGILEGGEGGIGGARRRRTGDALAVVGTGQDMDPDEFRERLTRARGSSVGLALNAAENAQTGKVLNERASSEIALQRGAGIGTSAGIEATIARGSNDQLNATLTRLESTISSLQAAVKAGGSRFLGLEQAGLVSSPTEQLEAAQAEYQSVLTQIRAAQR
jgi:outer membrane murein-binding lipoprotein Lpp